MIRKRKRYSQEPPPRRPALLHTKSLTAIALICITVAAKGATAAEALRGADAVLKSLEESTKDTGASKPLNEATKFHSELTNFTARAASLPPQSAAKEWLGFMDRVMKATDPGQPSRTQDDTQPPQVADVLAALPPPATWTEIAKAIANRPEPTELKDAGEIGLRMLAHALNADLQALAKLSSDLETMLAKASREDARPLLQTYRQLDTALLAVSDDPKALLAGVERSIKAADRSRNFGYSSINLPDLVGILGEKEATPYIRRALVSKAMSLTIEGEATRSLARKIALSAIEEMQVPRWSLVDTLETVELYEAIEKKFSATKKGKPSDVESGLADLESNDDLWKYEQANAKTYYLMTLILKGRTSDAADLVRHSAKSGDPLSIETSAVASLERAGFTEALDNFLYELLAKSPELPQWDAYFSAAAKTGKTDRMLKLARTAAAKPELASNKTDPIRENLFKALLAADLIDEGIQELRTLIAIAQKDLKTAVASSNHEHSSRDEQLEYALTLARVGHLLEKPEWVTEGLAAAEALAGARLGGKEAYMVDHLQNRLAHELIQNGLVSKAEALLSEKLTQAVHASPKTPRYPWMGVSANSPQTALISLLELYHGAGRPEDVLLLLEKAPQWGAKDLAGILSPQSHGSGLDFNRSEMGMFTKVGKGNRLAHAVATALIHAGRKSEARAVVDFMLDETAGDDRAFELLILLAGQDARIRLDELFARDQFEERPLIWKAVLLHQAHEDAEAEKLARQAISIDPSDGEQPKGDRMRVYSVLSDIREARGDAKEAGVLRSAVKAIRLSEQADDFMRAGLMTRSVRMYQESLKHFTDAYCIQSRLAVQLTALGQHSLAAKHYEKAFELMPDSFGRVESHCFGCEGVFGDTQAKSVAERVFTTLAAKSPAKPQIHYLLGYLRDQEDRSMEALPHFRNAVELDPDYLNAWERLGGIAQQHRLPSAQRDTISLNIFRLDPLGRHCSANLTQVSDLKRLWAGVESAAKIQIKRPASLLALTASRAAGEKNELSSQSPADMFRGRYSHSTSRNSPASSPGQAIAQNALIQAISGLIKPESGRSF